MTKRRADLASKYASESFPTRPNGSKRYFDSQERTLQDGLQRATNNSQEGIVFYAANTDVLLYQAKLLEIARANIRFAFEFVQGLTTIRSPVEFPGVMAELTSKRIAIFCKHWQSLQPERPAQARD
jgi:hypothetical protein